jgi:predicted DNA-binding WGR domain protein
MDPVRDRVVSSGSFTTQEMPMARYERAEKSEFWSIDVEGTQVTIYSGAIGMQGKGTATKYASTGECMAARDKLVAQQLKKGFVPVPDAPDTVKYDRYEKVGDGVTEVIEVELSDRGFAAWFGKGKTGRGVDPFATLEIARTTPDELLVAYEEQVAQWRSHGYVLASSDDHATRTPPPPPKVKPAAKAKKT